MTSALLSKKALGYFVWTWTVNGSENSCIATAYLGHSIYTEFLKHGRQAACLLGM
jgi:hypothetical protein